MKKLALFIFLLAAFSAECQQQMMLHSFPPPAVSAFDPSTVPGYLLDYDVDALELNDGDLVSTLTDKSPNDFHATASGAARPYWTNSAEIGNGLGFLKFASGNYLQTNFSSVSQPTTCFYVGTFKYRGSSTTYQYDSASASRQGLFHGISEIYMFGASLLGNGHATLTNNIVYIFEAHYNGAASQLLINGVGFSAVGDAGSAALGGITVNGNNSGTSNGTNEFWRMIYFASNVTNSNGTFGYGGTGDASNVVYYLSDLYR